MTFLWETRRRRRRREEEGLFKANAVRRRRKVNSKLQYHREMRRTSFFAKNGNFTKHLW